MNDLWTAIGSNHVLNPHVHLKAEHYRIVRIWPSPRRRRMLGLPRSRRTEESAKLLGNSGA